MLPTLKNKKLKMILTKHVYEDIRVYDEFFFKLSDKVFVTKILLLP